MASTMSSLILGNPMQKVGGFIAKTHTDTYEFISPLKLNMKDKAVLVTGASKGVGKAMAISYAKAGTSQIAILARTDLTSVAQAMEEAATKAGRNQPKILRIKCDITRVDDCAKAAKLVEQEFGRLDILINNAGYLETWKKIHESDPEDWWRTWEVNVKGVYLISRAFLPILLRGGEKTIVTTSSGGAMAITPSASAYQSTKQAELRFNDFLTAEYGEEGLLAYAIHPGGVKTDLANGMPEWMYHLLTEEPELPGDTIVWLTSEKRDWLADRWVNCCWDMEELLKKRRDIEDNELLRMRLRV